jgi:Protein of unknown function (DUF2891)
MADVMPREDFAAGLTAFLPQAVGGEPATLFTPATVSDRTDGRSALGHVSGDYMGEHWLATFALLALDDPPGS